MLFANLDSPRAGWTTRFALLTRPGRACASREGNREAAKTSTRSVSARPLRTMQGPVPELAAEDRARNRKSKLGGRRKPCSAERRIFLSDIRGACPHACISRAESPDSRAVASSNAPARLRRYRDSVHPRGSASGSDGLTQYCLEMH